MITDDAEQRDNRHISGIGGVGVGDGDADGGVGDGDGDGGVGGDDDNNGVGGDGCEFPAVRDAQRAAQGLKLITAHAQRFSSGLGAVVSRVVLCQSFSYLCQSMHRC